MNIKIYDISQEILNAEIYPGDPKPWIEKVTNMDKGDKYNTSAFYMCAHTGTHVDAPNHFIENAKSIDEVSLEKFIGPAYVHTHNGVLSADDAKNIYELAKSTNTGAHKRILIKGNAVVSLGAAKMFKDLNLDLVGNESQSVGPYSAPMAVHLELLGIETVLLEGIRLDEVNDGVYLLNSAPINIKGSDGCPCRAVLIEGIY